MCIESIISLRTFFACFCCLALRASGGVVLVDAPPGMLVVSSPGSPGQLQVVDFNQDGQDDVQFWSFPGGADAYVGNGSRLAVVTSRPDRPGGGLAPLNVGDLIGADLSVPGVSWYGGFPVDDVDLPVLEGVGGPLLANQVDLAFENTGGVETYFEDGGIVGVEFLLEDGLHYGWVEILNDESEPWGGAIIRWGWETEPGKAIIAGTVPEPTILMLVFGSGLIPLLLGRRRAVVSAGK